MRVGVIGPVAPDYFADNLGDSLQQMGHQVSLLGSARAQYAGRITTRLAQLVRQSSPRLDELAQQRITRAALNEGCEVIINLDASLTPSVVAQLRRSGCRVALWFPDAVSNLGRQLMLLASYDAIFFKDPHVVDRLKAMLDLPIYYLPEACNPRWHRPLTPAGVDPYLVIAGNMYPSRVRLLDRLIEKGIPLKVFGNDIPHWIGDSPARGVHTGRYLVREEKARIFRSAAGVLNTMHPAEIAGVNVRLFEAAGCGAAVLTEFRPTVPELFTVDDEVLTFHDFDDIIEQADRLLNEPGLTARLGDAAARRAHRDHTYEVRVAEILEKIR